MEEKGPSEMLSLQSSLCPKGHIVGTVSSFCQCLCWIFIPFVFFPVDLPNVRDGGSFNVLPDNMYCHSNASLGIKMYYICKSCVNSSALNIFSNHHPF
jgi:hypothetical protein